MDLQYISRLPSERKKQVSSVCFVLCSYCTHFMEIAKSLSDHKSRSANVGKSRVRIEKSLTGP